VTQPRVSDLMRGKIDLFGLDTLVNMAAGLQLLVHNVDLDIPRLGGAYRRRYGPSHGVLILDALIAATAQVHGAHLVTRNARHFPMLDDLLVPYQ
jgi:predicted nucleic acid-binding protein